ncbi:MAG: GspE/PulE family protein [Patescibacteria group bacterium]
MEEQRKKVLGSVEIPEAISKDLKKTLNVPDFGKKIKEYSSHNTTDLLDAVLFGSINLSASDIHIEPEENQTILRIRIDGILQDVIFFEKEIYHNLLSRIKLLSKIKLNITDSPQDGRFTILEEDLLIEIRTSTLPAEYGESIVMRILNPKNLLNLENLGLRKDLYEIFNAQIQKPNGMIIVTGPTGAGKTTTLYAFLMKAKNRGIEIITIEDPIEYHIEGILQTQVAPEKGYTFSEGLRSIVRQDPDLILVGEVRDAETAKIALQSSLTGHLVFSTLHTNDAAGTIPRLIDLGASASSVAPALKMVVAQRLVREVCKECSELKNPTNNELKEIKEGLENVKIAELPKDFNKIKITKANEKGCKHCNFTGYKGRKGLFEVFLLDAEIEKLILKNPAVSEIKELLAKRGMVTMYQSGLIEVVLGETTLEEMKKVVESDE